MRLGRPLGDMMERFYNYVEVSDSGCWEWQGEITRNGYPRFYYNYTRWLAHRFSYMVHKTELTDGLVIDHLCRNTHCVNPDHLEEVTGTENVRRGIVGQVTAARHAAKRKDVCMKGHSLLDPENVYIRNLNNRWTSRKCKTCYNEYYRNWKRRRKEAAING